MKAPVATFPHGAPIPRHGLTASLTAGPHGPILLEDFAFYDHLSHFDRERVPERVVHAKGAGAFGYFEVTSSEITKYCKAKLFSHVGKRTPLAVRFSQATLESGSPDSVRDIRGMALKFYTEEVCDVNVTQTSHSISRAIGILSATIRRFFSSATQFSFRLYSMRSRGTHRPI